MYVSYSIIETHSINVYLWLNESQNADEWKECLSIFNYILLYSSFAISSFKFRIEYVIRYFQYFMRSITFISFCVCEYFQPICMLQWFLSVETLWVWWNMSFIQALFVVLCMIVLVCVFMTCTVSLLLVSWQYERRIICIYA